MRVAFLHPDLGLGGAERFVVDAACELQQRGHEVDMYTAYHDPNRCFKETMDGTLRVKVHGGWFPRTIFGLAHAFCAYIRCILIALALVWRTNRFRQYDIIFVDQVSVVVPVLHAFLPSKVLFYCHHPDLLLAQRRPGLHQLYRKPLDWLEEVTTGQADQILVNSKYTAKIFEETFAKLHAQKCRPAVLYPACSIIPEKELLRVEKSLSKLLPTGLGFMQNQPTFLSINRFERKKAVELAVTAYHHVLSTLGELEKPPEAASCRLVLAGGCDQRLAENREYWEELHQLAERLGISSHVAFVGSFSDQQKSALLLASQALVYTPSNEHFGIVPLEAMSHGRPVLACSSGGPLETVVDNQTGYLCDADASSFSSAMLKILKAGEAGEHKKMRHACRSHVQRSFSRQTIGDQLQRILKQMTS